MAKMTKCERRAEEAFEKAYEKTSRIYDTKYQYKVDHYYDNPYNVLSLFNACAIDPVPAIGKVARRGTRNYVWNKEEME